MRVWISGHAAQRFMERVRPDLELGQASWLLGRWCRELGVIVDRPHWVASEEVDEEGVFWLELSDGIAVPVAPARNVRMLPTALSVLIRSGMSEGARRRLNYRRARRTAAARARSYGRRPVEGADFGPSIDD